ERGAVSRRGERTRVAMREHYGRTIQQLSTISTHRTVDGQIFLVDRDCLPAHLAEQARGALMKVFLEHSAHPFYRPSQVDRRGTRGTQRFRYGLEARARFFSAGPLDTQRHAHRGGDSDCG